MRCWPTTPGRPAGDHVAIPVRDYRKRMQPFCATQVARPKVFPALRPLGLPCPCAKRQAKQRNHLIQCSQSPRHIPSAAIHAKKQNVSF